MDVGDGGQVVRRPLIAVGVDVCVAGDAYGQEVECRAGDDLVGPERHGEHRVDERQYHAGGDADDDAADPRAGDVRAPGAEVGAHEHHALERDVDDPRTLGEQAAE